MQNKINFSFNINNSTISNKGVDTMKTKIDSLTFLDNMHYFPEIVKQYYIPDDMTFHNIEKDILELFMRTCEKKRNEIVNNFMQMISDKYFELNPEGILTDEIIMKFTFLFVKDEIVVFENEKFFTKKEVDKYIGNIDHKFVIQLVIDNIFDIK